MSRTARTPRPFGVFRVRHSTVPALGTAGTVRRVVSRPSTEDDQRQRKGWTWVHTVLVGTVWVLGLCPAGQLGVWLDGTLGWPALLAVGAFLAGYLAIGLLGTVALLTHAELRESAGAGPVDPQQRRKELGSGLAMGAGLAGITVVGIAVSVAVLYLIGHVAVWLHETTRLPAPVAGILAGLLVLGSIVAVAVTVFSRFDRRSSRDSDASHVTHTDPAGHAEGPRELDPLLAHEVESMAGRRVRMIVRTSETVTNNLDWAAEEEFWDLNFALDNGEAVHCSARGHRDEAADRADRMAKTYRKRGYRKVETLAGPGEGAVAVTAPGSHRIAWTQLGRRWSIEVTTPASVEREVGMALLRCAADRLGRLTATGALPVPAATAPSALAQRLPRPLRAADFAPITGHPADDESAELTGHPSQSETGWWDDYWYEDFYLRDGEEAIEARVQGVRGSRELLACDRRAWKRLGQHRPVETEGDEAFLIEGGSPYEHDGDRRSLWVRLKHRWVLQVIATPGLGEAQLIALANLAISRLTGNDEPRRTP
jgi:hypothetical protein